MPASANFRRFHLKAMQDVTMAEESFRPRRAGLLRTFTVM